jgi:cell division septum initiation protein DivIVA
MASPNPPPKSPAKASTEASPVSSEDQELASLTLKEAEDRAAAMLAEAEKKAQDLLDEAEKRVAAADRQATERLAEMQRLLDEAKNGLAEMPQESRRAPARIVEPVTEGNTRIRPMRTERATIAGVPYNFEVNQPITVPSEIVPHLIRVGIVAEGPEYGAR